MQRKSLEEEINGSNGQTRKTDLSLKSGQLNSNVRKSARKDKMEFINAIATEAETAHGKRI